MVVCMLFSLPLAICVGLLVPAGGDGEPSESSSTPSLLFRLPMDGSFSDSKLSCPSPDSPVKDNNIHYDYEGKNKPTPIFLLCKSWWNLLGMDKTGISFLSQFTPKRFSRDGVVEPRQFEQISILFHQIGWFIIQKFEMHLKLCWKTKICMRHSSSQRVCNLFLSSINSISTSLKKLFSSIRLRFFNCWREENWFFFHQTN